MKRLVIGDIHGCFSEFMDLVEKAGLTAEDEIVSVGDLVDRGPDSVKVLDFFRTQAQARAIMGNHERKHVNSFRGKIRPALSQQITRREFGEDRYREAVEWMDKLPRWFDYPEAIVVHAFLEPGIPLDRQRENVIVGTMSGEEYMKKTYDRPWHDLYAGEKPVIVGHLDYLRSSEPMILGDKVYCIDTGCCRGGKLTGVVLPEFRVFSVAARRDYWSESLEVNADLRAGKKVESPTWEKIRETLEAARRQPSLPPRVRERVEQLRQTLEKGEAAARAIFDRMKRDHEAIEARLRAETPFAKASKREQGSLYAAAAKGHPLVRFLHLARKGRLTMEELCSGLETPSKAIEIAAGLGLK